MNYIWRSPVHNTYVTTRIALYNASCILAASRFRQLYNRRSELSDNEFTRESQLVATNYETERTIRHGNVDNNVFCSHETLQSEAAIKSFHKRFNNLSILKRQSRTIYVTLKHESIGYRSYIRTVCYKPNENSSRFSKRVGNHVFSKVAMFYGVDKAVGVAERGTHLRAATAADACRAPAPDAWQVF